jgi:hypothetical protein
MFVITSEIQSKISEDKLQMTETLYWQAQTRGKVAGTKWAARLQTIIPAHVN